MDEEDDLEEIGRNEAAEDAYLESDDEPDETDTEGRYRDAYDSDDDGVED